ncbi:hypothetical protein Bxe_A0520 [Paraburkholderia xenovorans LB400]|uniref:Uncharacterized protein n=1 Tax=Paraburkholderia xenovorans (strain LB400) TaxID=266265 RepID=Q13U26_PARXL|nr:hypothetical protein Bxe_A0520 [Paraburkholderia xenovorans LB400]
MRRTRQKSRLRKQIKRFDLSRISTILGARNSVLHYILCSAVHNRVNNQVHNRVYKSAAPRFRARRRKHSRQRKNSCGAAGTTTGGIQKTFRKRA